MIDCFTIKIEPAEESNPEFCIETAMAMFNAAKEKGVENIFLTSSTGLGMRITMKTNFEDVLNCYSEVRERNAQNKSQNS
ncbi:MAG: hypothetical protein LBU68_01990 [Rickettsiales bacterium]|jgi:tyrosine-protein phosphatase YwqE|nr:hypothetical protein [Rickettsiales bacterium]